jgi:hypothetical protein
LRRGSGWVDLAVHVSAPWTPWPPLCMVIEKTWRTFFTHARDVRSNSVNSRDAWMRGPHGVWSCQCQAILAEDSVTTRRSQASSLTSLPVDQFPFGPRDKRSFGFSYFRGMYFGNPNFFGAGCEGNRSIVNQKNSYGCEQESQDLI